MCGGSASCSWLAGRPCSTVSMPQKTLCHERLAHELQDLRVLGDVQRELAGEANRIVAAPLPLDEVRQEVQRGPRIPDEVVVHEVDRRRPAVGELIELDQNLLRALEPSGFSRRARGCRRTRR